MIAKGVPWGHPAGGPANLDVAGDDVALAAAVTARPRARVVFRPTSASDFARAVGIAVGATPGPGEPTEVPCDLLRVHTGNVETTAVNMVVVGVAPDHQRWTSRSAHVRVTVDGRPFHVGPATAVVVANGQYLRGADVVPRGHPGDGRAEVHVYALGRGERRRMRERLPRGEQVPHPRITTASGRSILIESLGAPVPLEVDGLPAGNTPAVSVDVAPAAFSLLL
jgi:hypothetical protein